MLSHLKCQGSAFEVGQALGRFGAAAVHEVLLNSEAWAQVMRWRSSTVLQYMAGLVQQRLPAIWQELQGLASGLELPLDDVFAWNCRGDVWAMAPDGCTTVQLPGTAYPSFAHNEDGNPGLLGRCALAEIQVTGGGHFAAVVYPGSLPGHTIGVTQGGLAITVNNIRTLHAAPGLPRMVLARALLDQASAAAAIELLKSCRRSGGFHLTLGQAGIAELFSVEFNAHHCSVVTITRPSVHANHMVHAAMAHQPQIVTGSSGHRQIRGERLLDEACRQGQPVDALSILFDQGHPKFPIFRDDPRDTDRENTVATACIEVGAASVKWQVHTQRSLTPQYRLTNGELS
ncbi:MAG: peptidase C45 [Betaproteobacteria bacterium HGW-Betaproteobacteria-16]|nr:MAG: peptidase C45 [Betaproteobacteria bacterium HGW-Betaproteobacteria-16]